MTAGRGSAKPVSFPGVVHFDVQGEVAKVLSLIEAGTPGGDHEWTVWETAATPMVPVTRSTAVPAFFGDNAR
jgi:hypothetical protein